jgi:hypothetical protein
MSAGGELARNNSKRHRHAVDLRRKRFGDEGEFHLGTMNLVRGLITHEHLIPLRGEIMAVALQFGEKSPR